MIYVKIVQYLNIMITNDIYQLGQDLFRINRSLTGKGTLKTLKLIKKKIPLLKIKSIKRKYKSKYIECKVAECGTKVILKKYY